MKNNKYKSFSDQDLIEIYNRLGRRVMRHEGDKYEGLPCGFYTDVRDLIAAEIEYAERGYRTISMDNFSDSSAYYSKSELKNPEVFKKLIGIKREEYENAILYVEDYFGKAEELPQK